MNTCHVLIFLLSTGLIDYNFHCFRKAIQDVFELRNKVTSNNSLQSSSSAEVTQVNGPGQNGLPPPDVSAHTSLKQTVQNKPS